MDRTILFQSSETSSSNKLLDKTCPLWKKNEDFPTSLLPLFSTFTFFEGKVETGENWESGKSRENLKRSFIWMSLSFKSVFYNHKKLLAKNWEDGLLYHFLLIICLIWNAGEKFYNTSKCTIHIKIWQQGSMQSSN